MGPQYDPEHLVLLLAGFAVWSLSLYAYSRLGLHTNKGPRMVEPEVTFNEQRRNTSSNHVRLLL